MIPSCLYEFAYFLNAVGSCAPDFSRDDDLALGQSRVVVGTIG